MPCLLASSAQVGGAGSCWVAKYSSRAFCMHDSFSSSALHAFTAAGTGWGIGVKLWLQGYPILMCGLCGLSPLKNISIDIKHIILNAIPCFWQSHMSTHAFSSPERWGEHSDAANWASDRFSRPRQVCTCWEAFPKFITNIFTYDSIAQIVIGVLCYLWLTEWYSLLSGILL